jgi:hypothetical protein
MKKFDFIKVYLSPFKPPIPKFYIGRMAIGTPYFYPRRWVRTKGEQKYKAVPKKIGFDFIGLGWKVKWDEYRFEWAPIWSFVFFGLQVAVMFRAIEENHFWECWLYYQDTDKSMTIAKRIKSAMERYPCIWISHSLTTKKKICYWDIILKRKWKQQK